MDFLVSTVEPFREYDRPFVCSRTRKDCHLETAVIGTPLHMPVAGRLAILENVRWFGGGFAHIELTPQLLSESIMCDNEIDQIGRHNQMHVCAVVVPYRDVQCDGGSRLVGSRFRLGAQFPIGVEPGFEWPISNAAGKGTFRPSQVSDQLAGI